MNKADKSAVARLKKLTKERLAISLVQSKRAFFEAKRSSDEAAGAVWKSRQEVAKLTDELAIERQERERQTTLARWLQDDREYIIARQKYMQATPDPDPAVDEWSKKVRESDAKFLKLCRKAGVPKKRKTIRDEICARKKK